jgi:hypothetical protein
MKYGFRNPYYKHVKIKPWFKEAGWKKVVVGLLIILLVFGLATCSFDFFLSFGGSSIEAILGGG